MVSVRENGATGMCLRGVVNMNTRVLSFIAGGGLCKIPIQSVVAVCVRKTYLRICYMLDICK